MCNNGGIRIELIIQPAGEAQLAAAACHLLGSTAGSAVPAKSTGWPSGAAFRARPDHVEAVGQNIQDWLRLLSGTAPTGIHSVRHCKQSQLDHMAQRREQQTNLWSH